MAINLIFFYLPFRRQEIIGIADDLLPFKVTAPKRLLPIEISVGNFISRNFSVQSIHLPFLSGSKKNFFVAA